MLVTPAFPETGRTVYLGHLFVGSVPLNESPLKDHPLNPMRDSNLVRVLQRQSKAPVGLVALPTVVEGGAAIMRRLAELEHQGCGAAIVDAVFERDLEAIGEAAARGPVSVGASGLGLGLARAFARGRAAGAATRPWSRSAVSPPFWPVRARARRSIRSRRRRAASRRCAFRRKG